MGISNLFKCIFRPEKKEALSCPHHRVRPHVCKQASFPRAAARAMERIPWLAAAWSAAGKQSRAALGRAAPARPVRRRDKVQCPVVSQPGSRWGLPLFTLGEDGGVQGRRESLRHVLPTARHPTAAPFLMIYAAAGWGLVSWAVSCRSRWDSQARTPDPGDNRKQNLSSSQGGEGSDKYFVSLTFLHDSSPKDPCKATCYFQGNRSLCQNAGELAQSTRANVVEPLNT